MSLFDYFVLTYLAWGAIRGSWRGLYRELYGVLSALLVLALLSGYGLISSIWRLVSQLNQYSLQLSGVLGYFVLLLATILLLWRIRRSTQELKQGNGAGYRCAREHHRNPACRALVNSVCRGQQSAAYEPVSEPVYQAVHDPGTA